MLFAQAFPIGGGSIPWYAWIAIIAIVGGLISGLTKMVIAHREKMALIAQGMNPDPPSDSSKARIGEL